MSTPERELALAQRRAFVEGVLYWAGETRLREVSVTEIHASAKRQFPLPKRTVPRVVQDPARGSIQFRVLANRLEVRGFPGFSNEWTSANDEHLALTPERIRLWADLFANPTEEAEDDECRG